MIRAPHLTTLLFLLTCAPCCSDSSAATNDPVRALAPDPSLMRSMQQMATDHVTGTVTQLHQLVEGVTNAPILKAATAQARQAATELEASLQQLEQLRTKLSALPAQFAKESPALITQIQGRIEELKSDPKVAKQLTGALTQLRDRLNELLAEEKR